LPLSCSPLFACRSTGVFPVSSRALAVYFAVLLAPLGIHLGPSFRRPLLGEVQPGELLEQFDRLAVVRPRRLGLDVDVAQIETLFAKADTPVPFTTPLVVVDALVDGGGADVLAPIVRVLPWRDVAHIDAGIIEPVAVDVVHDPARRGPHDLAVHVDQLALFVAPGVPVAVRAPMPLIEPLVVRGVHVGIVPVRQRDPFDIFARGRRRPGPVIPAGHARHVVQLPRPEGMIGALRRQRLAHAQRAQPPLRLAH